MANFIIGALVGLALGFLIAYYDWNRTITEILDELDENDKGGNANGTESKSEKT